MTCPKVSSVSIVVPLRNEARHVERFLATLTALRYEDGPVEVFLVEGASGDETRAHLEAALPELGRARPNWSFHLLHNPSGQIPHGLNLGISRATGDVILRLDAHTLFPPEYIEACVRTLAETGAANVGGVVIAHPGDESATARAIARARSDVFGAGRSSFRTGFTSGPRGTVPFGCFSRATFERFGLFDERLLRNQDIELNRRIREGGGVVYQNGALVSRYLAPTSFSALWRKHLANGEWNIYATAVNPGCLSRSHAVPILFLVIVAASALVAWWAPPALLALLLTADLLRALQVGRGVSKPRLAAAFAVILLAHGLGQIKGALLLPRFLVRAARTPRFSESLADRGARILPQARQAGTRVEEHDIDETHAGR